MPPAASILLPTRRRLPYLAVALASVATQARAHGAEIVVVEDDPADPATERLAGELGARYVAHGEVLGLNAARNTAITAAQGELLCFIDDDVEAWPGWLAALLAGAASAPGYDVLGGPIHARLEGTNLHTCGREPPPITTLDLGSADTDAEFVWGANMALHRRALERAGGFDERLDLYGDEEEWQRRLRAAGGRVRYVAAAGVDHRRTGADARIAGLSRAAYQRGRNSRRYDVRKATQPPLVGELRTLAGCVWHTGRYRCGNGIVLAALTAGRLRETLLPAAVPASARDPDYLSGSSGTLGERDLLVARVRDAAAYLRDAPLRRRLRTAAALEPPRRRVQVVGIARPEHEANTARLRRELRRTRHDLVVRFAPGAAGAGKWANLNAMLRANPPTDADWLLLVDDDVALPRGFLDLFLLAAERAGLQLAQPAHAFASHAAWPVTRRRPGLMARRTRFVEIGPVTALHSDAIAALLPFPDLRMGWGLDAYWSAQAQSAGLSLGIVDVTPLRHLRPVASAYPRGEAIVEAEAFLAARRYVTRAEAGEVLASYKDAG
jgi:GT2 family glycosyltransferase